MTGAAVDDWEDLAVGPCPEGSCLYIADIGDNNRARRQITIYRVPEPRPDDKATAARRGMDVAYPDGAHDAEALFVTPNGQLFLVSKENARTTALYRVPAPAGGGRTLEPCRSCRSTAYRGERIGGRQLGCPANEYGVSVLSGRRPDGRKEPPAAPIRSQTAQRSLRAKASHSARTASSISWAKAAAEAVRLPRSGARSADI